MEINALTHSTFRKIGIIGLGYVGLPLAVEFARKDVEAVYKGAGGHLVW